MSGLPDGTVATGCGLFHRAVFHKVSSAAGFRADLPVMLGRSRPARGYAAGSSPEPAGLTQDLAYSRVEQAGIERDCSPPHECQPMGGQLEPDPRRRRCPTGQRAEPARF
jgi:hypothetical protein